MNAAEGTSSSEGRPHIAFLVNNYPPKIGGVESHVSQLAEHLVLEGARVTVVALDNTTPSAWEAGVDVRRLRSTRAIGGVLALPLPGTARRLRRLLRASEVDVVSTHTRFFPMSFLGVRVASRLGIPSIHTEHGADWVRGTTRLVSAASRLVDLTMGRYVLRKATVVLGVSEPVNAFVFRLARVVSRTFHNGIIARIFQDQGTPDQDGVARARHRLVFVGRFVEGKGWERLLRVAEQLAPEFPDLDLHFIGEGPLQSRLLGLVAASSIRGQAVVHGRLGQPEIARILRDAILVNPSVLAEGFQTTVLEAVAARAAVVTTPVPSAVVLNQLGADVRIVHSSDDADWVAAVREAMESDRRPADAVVAAFDWRSRARVFLDHVADATRHVDG